MTAPRINIKQARNPGLLPGAAPIENCVTGLFLCIKYRLGCSHSRFREQQYRRLQLKTADPHRECRSGCMRIDSALAKGAHCAEHHLMKVNYGFITSAGSDAHHIHNMGLLPVCFPVLK
jgi:hypothetical protein